jgi:protein TonB
MEINIEQYYDFDDIVFRNRNKEYGAFVLRKRYNRNVIISTIIGILILAPVVLLLYLKSLNSKVSQSNNVRQVEIQMDQLDQPAEKVAPPPPPPPQDVIPQQKYVPPQVVEEVSPEDLNKLMTADQAQEVVVNKEVVEVVEQAREEVPESTTEPEPFLFVEEMPEPPGGFRELYRYIAQTTVYPETALENNIQGKVIVSFCVTPKGTVDRVGIFKAVDPVLDSEAIRVVKTFPKFKPGKQAGIPVPVWVKVFINFQIQR